ncbi:hypothetical protein PG991_012520 [Apiospora marii]|uniref:EKC/KEOPS complex subunit CGI121 n=1 Tax=Apiospora marii TaxID=335849 RepID=A0ABR1RA27_9PEZI
MQPCSDSDPQSVSSTIPTLSADQDQSSRLGLAVLIKLRTEDALRIVIYVKDRHTPERVYDRLRELHRTASDSIGNHGESLPCYQVDAAVPPAATVLSQLALLKVSVPKVADAAANMSDEERKNLEQILGEETNEGQHQVVMTKPDTALFATLAAMKDLDTNICTLQKLSRETGRAIRDHDSKYQEKLPHGEENSGSMGSVPTK